MNFNTTNVDGNIVSVVVIISIPNDSNIPVQDGIYESTEVAAACRTTKKTKNDTSQNEKKR